MFCLVNGIVKPETTDTTLILMNIEAINLESHPFRETYIKLHAQPRSSSHATLSHTSRRSLIAFSWVR